MVLLSALEEENPNENLTVEAIKIRDENQSLPRSWTKDCSVWVLMPFGLG